MSSIRPSSKITVSTFHPGPRAEHGFAGVHFATLVVEIRAIDKVSQKTREGRCPDTGRPAVFEAARRLFDDEASHSSVVVELHHVRPLILIGGEETHHEVGTVGVLALDEPAIDVRRLQEDVGESPSAARFYSRSGKAWAIVSSTEREFSISANRIWRSSARPSRCFLRSVLSGLRTTHAVSMPAGAYYSSRYSHTALSFETKELPRRRPGIGWISLLCASPNRVPRPAAGTRPTTGRGEGRVLTLRLLCRSVRRSVTRIVILGGGFASINAAKRLGSRSAVGGRRSR